MTHLVTEDPQRAFARKRLWIKGMRRGIVRADFPNGYARLNVSQRGLALAYGTVTQMFTTAVWPARLLNPGSRASFIMAFGGFPASRREANRPTSRPVTLSVDGRGSTSLGLCVPPSHRLRRRIGDRTSSWNAGAQVPLSLVGRGVLSINCAGVRSRGVLLLSEVLPQLGCEPIAVDAG